MLPEVVHFSWTDPAFMPPRMQLFFSWIARFRKISIFLNMHIWGEHILPMHGWSIDMGPRFLCSVSSLPMEHILRLQGLQITIKISHRNFQNNPQNRKSIWQILETPHYFASTVREIIEKYYGGKIWELYWAGYYFQNFLHIMAYMDWVSIWHTFPEICAIWMPNPRMP